MEKNSPLSLVIFHTTEWKGTTHNPKQHICDIALKHRLFTKKACVFQQNLAEHCGVPQILCGLSLRTQVAHWNNGRRTQSTWQSQGHRPKAGSGCTAAGAESSNIRAEAAALRCTDAPGCTGRAESICPMQTHKAQIEMWLFFWDTRAGDTRDTRQLFWQACQQEIFFSSAGRCKAVQQKEDWADSWCNEEELYVMRILSVHLSRGYISNPDM